jgi:hypothetical protein
LLTDVTEHNHREKTSMQSTNSKPKFNPGVLLATPGAVEAFEKN